MKTDTWAAVIVQDFPELWRTRAIILASGNFVPVLWAKQHYRYENKVYQRTKKFSDAFAMIIKKLYQGTDLKFIEVLWNISQ